ncbi:MAG: YHS domain-containing protein [Gammaproteobacteria bacterium]|jgi:YHS domain-containing protein|nr:YHS domain-containing protein [Gammaproteobacteria bacterium]
MKHKDDERTFKDPVCGMEVSHLSAIATTDHEGKTYYFCSDGCRDAFVAEPGKYLKHHRQHGLE